MNRHEKRPRKRNKNYVKEKHLMDIDTFYHIEYKRLVKQAKVWNDTGQYWLGKECERRANAILNENIEEYKLENHSEKLFFKTKKYL